jgi:hypothetical protein
MRVVFASARSSPGVTTAALACASVWPGRVLLVEASEDGGAVAARFGLALEPGLTTLATAFRHEGQTAELAAHLQPLPGTEDRVTALLGPAATEPAQALLRSSASRLAGLLPAGDDPVVLIDAGRLPAAPLAAPLLAAADQLVLVTRPRLEELQALAQRLPRLAGVGPALALLLVGDRPYGPAEVAANLDVPVLGVLADDAHAADALGGMGVARGLRRSQLLRSAAGLVERLVDLGPAEVSEELAAESAAAPPPGVNGAPVTRSRWSLVGRS